MDNQGSDREQFEMAGFCAECTEPVFFFDGFCSRTEEGEIRWVAHNTCALHRLFIDMWRENGVPFEEIEEAFREAERSEER